MKLKIALLTCAFAAACCAAPGIQVLHSFGVGNDGSTLYGSLLLDTEGNLYGTALDGGTLGRGVVYRLSPKGSSWTETILYSFKGGKQDGANPHDALVMDSAGNLYGTTTAGGSGSCGNGCGTVFELSPTSSGSWKETVLYSFAGGSDGATPYSGVIFDTAGNLYGATTVGGSNQVGSIFRLMPGAGEWTKTILYNFTGIPDAATPYATPVFDSAGNLYGTTDAGGAANKGTVYELSPQADGSWKETILHSFNGTDGSDLFESLILDPKGNLYGAAETGGSANCGVAFKLSKNASGAWKETILHTFLGVTQQDGENPNALLFDPHGNIYGTTVGGGTDNPGTIFKLTHEGSGEWSEKILYNFTAGATGAYPSVPLIIDATGTLFGTTLWGGPAGDTTGGVAFEFVP